jgi:LacI family transcriptional regulator
VALTLELDWPYKRHAGIFAGTQQYAREQGWETSIDEYAAETLGAHPEQPPPYDGIIARATRKLARQAARRGVPVVNVWLSSPACRSLPGVFPDYAAAGRLRGEHLLARGLRRFAAVTQKTDRSQQVELKAFAAAVAEAGYPCLTATIPSSPARSLAQWRGAERTIAAWMKAWQPPIGVYAGREVEGGMVAEMCRNRGWRVPEDVAIIAGQNEETFCEHLRPTLSSIEFGFEQIGYEAARLLDRLMGGESPPPGPIWLPPQALIVRESTDFLAVDDKLIAAALAFIAANAHRPIGPDDVADAVATGQRTLSRRFQKSLRRTVAAEIRRVRIERAKRELAESDRPAGKISHAVGFGPPIHMHKVFVRELGLTPGEYRRQRHNKPGT